MGSYFCPKGPKNGAGGVPHFYPVTNLFGDVLRGQASADPCPIGVEKRGSSPVVQHGGETYIPPNMIQVRPEEIQPPRVDGVKEMDAVSPYPPELVRASDRLAHGRQAFLRHRVAALGLGHVEGFPGYPRLAGPLAPPPRTMPVTLDFGGSPGRPLQFGPRALCKLEQVCQVPTKITAWLAQLWFDPSVDGPTKKDWTAHTAMLVHEIVVGCRPETIGSMPLETLLKHQDQMQMSTASTGQTIRIMLENISPFPIEGYLRAHGLGAMDY